LTGKLTYIKTFPQTKGEHLNEKVGLKQCGDRWRRVVKVSLKLYAMLTAKIIYTFYKIIM
jgi:hypothetical protein